MSEMENQDLVSIADSYIQLAKSVNETLKQRDDLNILLSKLPDIKLDKNYVLDDFRPRGENNSVLRLYARKKSLKRPTDDDFESIFETGIKKRKVPVTLKIGGITFLRYWKTMNQDVKQDVKMDVFDCITVSWTEAGIWQAYLLKQTFHLIGMRWHGGYAARTFINKYENINHLYIRDEKNKKVRKEIEQIWTSDL